MTTQFICTKCDKYYKSYKSLYNHNQKFHSNKELIEEDFLCEYCSKSYTRKDNLLRHMKTCKDIELSETERQKKKMIETLSETYSKNDIIKIFGDNNSLTNCNNIHNNTQNINIMVNFGDEKLTELFSPFEQKLILNKKSQALDFFVKYAHLNDKYPQLQNIYIPKLDRSNAYIYDAVKGDFISVQKDKLFEDLLIDKINDLEDFYATHSDSLNKRTQKPVRKYLDKLANEHEKDDSKYIKDKKKDLQNIFYNDREQVAQTHKKNKLSLKHK